MHCSDAVYRTDFDYCRLINNFIRANVVIPSLHGRYTVQITLKTVNTERHDGTVACARYCHAFLRLPSHSEEVHTLCVVAHVMLTLQTSTNEDMLLYSSGRFHECASTVMLQDAREAKRNPEVHVLRSQAAALCNNGSIYNNIQEWHDVYSTRFE